MRLTHVLLLSALFIAGGCASSQSTKVYSRDHARRAQSSETGVVVSVSRVMLEGEESGAGAVAGGVAGGVAGHAVGGGSGQSIATVVGAIGGALLGSAIEKNATTADAFEIIVDLENGGRKVIVQEADVTFLPGDRVYIITASDGTARVRRAGG